MKLLTILQILFSFLVITNIAENNYTGVVVCGCLVYVITKAKYQKPIVVIEIEEIEMKENE